jgi:D-aminopeptidase
VASLTRTGSFISDCSGDYALAWSTHPSARLYLEKGRERHVHGSYISDVCIDPFFAAVCDATEEAFWNSMTHAETTVGFRGEVKALSCEDILNATE